MVALCEARMIQEKIDELITRTDDPEIKRVLHLTTTLFDKIQHGGDDHRDWLGAAIEAHFTDSEIPEYKK
ncbi:hypothetical protein ST201phi2-1p466 [Pseudomonas phage 201phi2-1]|uniref:Uncharacterized protein n=1 Tax=Pseudomonas phage 201phi2-1 TaxID=198110 RepID=B3FJX4_BP201|nr:hypothetical protein ST201phi2-1p466 [Pseudomonas phage 201phi2-1]ABY63289.1 hypothetical protein 201phi2-1p466 [Pseudomonas phage 201phi2-1]